MGVLNKYIYSMQEELAEVGHRHVSVWPMHSGSDPAL